MKQNRVAEQSTNQNIELKLRQSKSFEIHEDFFNLFMHLESDLISESPRVRETHYYVLKFYLMI